MGLFSGSFGRGLLTGFASSVDKSMQDALERRNSELSEARKYIKTRNAAKEDAYQARKLKVDQENKEAFELLATELGGDVDFTAAAFERLGSAEKVKAYLANVDKTRATLQPGQKYDAAADFEGYVRGETPITQSAFLASKSPEAPDLTVSLSMFEVDDPIGRLFGREGQAAKRAADRMNASVASTASAARPSLTGMGKVSGLDFTRQVAAQEAGFAATERARDTQRFDMEVGAFDQNAKRIDQAMQIADAAEARANRKEATDADQRARDNARQDVADLQRQQQLEREAENHILSKRAAEQGITLNELKIQKEKSPPEFKDFEEMFVYAEQKLAQGGLTPQQRNDFDALRQSAIDGTQAWKEANPEADDDAQFSPQSVNAVFNAQIKRTMGKAGLYDGVADKVKQITEGNAESYFDNFNQAINAVETTYGTSDETMRNAIEAQENVLAQDVRAFIDKQLAIPAQKSKRLKVFDGSPDELIDNAYTANAYSKGDIVQYNENGVTKYAIWTGRDLYDGDY